MEILEQKLGHFDVYKVVAYSTRSLTEVERRYFAKRTWNTWCCLGL